MSQRIRKIELKGKKIALELTRSQQPRGYNTPVKKNRRETTDQIPHGDLLRALERLTPHLQLVPGFSEETDQNGNFLQESHFADLWWQDDERYDGLTLTGVHVATKADETAIYLIGNKTNSRGGNTPIKTPIINFIITESDADYRFAGLVQRNFETLWLEVDEFIKGKTGDEQLQMSLNVVDVPKPKKKTTPVEDELPA